MTTPNPTDASTETSTATATTTAQAQLDQAQLEMLIQQKRDNQNLALGIVGGAIGALVGAVLWAVITAVTNFQIGFMAIGVGLLTGFGVRKFGQGIDKSFGVVGALLSVVGCLAGNLFAIAYVASNEFGVSAFSILAQMTPSVYASVFAESFSPIDLLFYGIAIYEGFKYSIVSVTLADIP